MEKTLTIDGKQVNFKSTGATPLRYKAQFGKDFFSELYKMNAQVKNEKIDANKIDFEAIYNIVWALAKTANKTIQEPLEWLDTFDEFPIYDVFDGLQDLLINSVQSNMSKKK